MKRKLIPILFGALIMSVCSAAIFFSWKSKLANALQKKEPLYGLIVGTDWVDNARHSDTILFARYTPENRSLDLLSIPRDTRVDVPHVRVKRINEVYAYAFKASKRNSEAACTALWETVSSLLFSSTETARPPLHFYAQIDYDGFRKIIDILGGVDVRVDEAMHYDDNWGKLHIHFATGTHHLGGQKALEYVRFRDSNGDSGRVSRQQEFLLKMIRRFTRPASILRMPKLILVSLKSVQTNLNWYERILTLHELRDISKERIRLIQLPGKAHQGYWIADPSDVLTTAALLGGRGTMAVENSTESVKAKDFSKVTVEVWNASSQKGLALVVLRSLRAAGFDVVKWGNYSSRQQKTLVRDHRGNTDAARAIAQTLKSPQTEVFTRLETDPLVDVEVILGEDYPRGK